MELERLEADKKKYESELVDLQKQIEGLDARKAEIVKVGTRIEGVLAYIRMRLSEPKAEGKPEDKV